MLREFYVDNFKSLINVTFRPHDVNLLLGLNNSGKTNLCQALRFVSIAAGQPLNNAALAVSGGGGRLTNFFFDKPTMEFRVDASLTFQNEDLDFSYTLVVRAPTPEQPANGFCVEREELVVTGGDFDNTPLLINTPTGARIRDERRPGGGEKGGTEFRSPPDATLLSRLFDVESNTRAVRFRAYLLGWQYYELSPTALRQPNHTPNVFVLATDGSNLGSVVYNLKTTNERAYRRLLDQLRRLDPQIELINFQPVSTNLVLMFFEDDAGHRLAAADASSGTLRYLALGYVLLAQPLMIEDPLLLIEEPENGLYVGLLRELLEMAAETDNRRQIVFTSHAPYFIDLFDDRLDSIFLLKRDEQHSQLVQPDAATVRRRLADFPLGEQHYREMLQ